MGKSFNVTPEEMPSRLTINLTKIERETLMDMLNNMAKPSETVRYFGTIVKRFHQHNGRIRSTKARRIKRKTQRTIPVEKRSGSVILYHTL